MPIINEPRIMKNYFEEDSSVSQVISKLRLTYKRGLSQGFDDRLCDRLKRDASQTMIDNARFEAHQKMRDLDKPTYLLAQNISNYQFGNKRKKEKRLIMLSEGVFHKGKNTIESIIPIDLGDNPYELYANFSGNTTTDEHITHFKTAEYLYSIKRELLAQGIDRFTIKSSRFYYIPEEDLFPAENDSYFLDRNGNIRFDLLVPLISYIPEKGFIVLDEPVRPTREEFDKYAPRTSTFRLKHSPQDKILKKLQVKGAIPEDRILCDWSGHRLVVSDMDLIDIVKSDFAKGYTFGKRGSRIKILDLKLKDYFEKPTDKDFKGLVYHTTMNIQGVVLPMEVQVQTIDNIFLYEVDFSQEGRKKPYSRYRYAVEKVRSEERISKQRKNLNFCMANILTEIFGTPQTSIDLKTMKIINGNR